MVAEIERYICFQNSGRSPSWICFTRVWTTHEEYLVVLVTIYNLVVIGAVVSIMCNFYILHVKLENAYSRPENRGFRVILPQNGEQYERDPQKAHPWAETRRMTYRSLKSVHLCALGASRRIKQKI